MKPRTKIITAVIVAVLVIIGGTLVYLQRAGKLKIGASEVVSRPPQITLFPSAISSMVAGEGKNITVTVTPASSFGVLCTSDTPNKKTIELGGAQSTLRRGVWSSQKNFPKGTFTFTVRAISEGKGKCLLQVPTVGKGRYLATLNVSAYSRAPTTGGTTGGTTTGGTTGGTTTTGGTATKITSSRGIKLLVGETQIVNVAPTSTFTVKCTAKLEVVGGQLIGDKSVKTFTSASSFTVKGKALGNGDCSIFPTPDSVNKSDWVNIDVVTVK